MFKPNELRLCVDMRKTNEAIKREGHVTPTTDDIILVCVVING